MEKREKRSEEGNPRASSGFGGFGNGGFGEARDGAQEGGGGRKGEIFRGKWEVCGRFRRAVLNGGVADPRQVGGQAAELSWWRRRWRRWGLGWRLQDVGRRSP